MSHRLGRAAQNIGIPAVADLNAPHAPAASYATLDICVDEHSYRSSTYRAFLPPELARARNGRLKVCTNTVVTRLEISKSGDALRATGVFFETADPRYADRRFLARATREVILCAGALASPQILMLRYVERFYWRRDSHFGHIAGLVHSSTSWRKVYLSSMTFPV